jgi:hypothetical protein
VVLRRLCGKSASYIQVRVRVRLVRAIVCCQVQVQVRGKRGGIGYLPLWA